MNKLRHQILSGELPERRSLLGTKRKKGADADAGLTSVDIPREETRTTHMRDGDRHRLLDQQVQVKHKRKLYTVQLVNLSGGGAMIAGDVRPNLWDRVDLRLSEDGVIECAVRWLRGDRIGLEFAHETRLDCSEEAKAKLLQAVIDLNFGDLEIEAPKRRKSDEPHAHTVVAPGSPKDQRGGSRHPLIWSGSLHYDFETIPVRLRNVSETGALIEGQNSLPVGAEPLLDLGDAGSIFATVTWAVGDQMGLKFHEPFDIQLLAQAKPQLAPVDWEAPSYTNRAGDDSSWNDGWNRMSLDELRDQLDGFLKH
jgi:PilZ domain-containing protein